LLLIQRHQEQYSKAAHSYLVLVYLTMSGNTDNAVLLAKAFSETKHVIDNKGLYNLDLDGDFQNLFNAIKLML
jgi:hypothetical protein